MLVVKNLNAEVVQRSTLFSEREKNLALQLIDKGFDWVPWFCTAEPELNNACSVSRNMTMDASSNYWGRILNVTKDYYTRQGKNFEQMMANELTKMSVQATSGNTSTATSTTSQPASGTSIYGDHTANDTTSVSNNTGTSTPADTLVASNKTNYLTTKNLVIAGILIFSIIAATHYFKNKTSV